MEITSIVENTSSKGLTVEHGLSLYIVLDDGVHVLFDMGQSALFAQNAAHLSLNITDVDVAVISHGHYDHGGGLKTFLSSNQKARIYIHEAAFQPHYSLRETGLRYIGLDQELQSDSRLVMCGDRTAIGPNMTLFADVKGNCCNPYGNRLLYGPSKTLLDTFGHEQNLIINEGEKTILLAGCAHRGIVNILHQAEQIIGHAPTHVLAGMHLVKSNLDEAHENAFIQTLSNELKKFDHTKFYTMHCTGEEQYEKLRSLMRSQIEYLGCGDRIII